MTSPLRIKICGITTEADACQAGWLGADAIGLNFCAESKRRVEPSAVESILRELPPFVTAVGVFCNQPLRQVFGVVGRYGGRLPVIQWHGTQHELSDTYPYQYMPAFPVQDQKSLAYVARYLEAARSVGQVPAAFLLDGHAPGQLGGTGQKAPWKLLAEFKPGVPFLLAGGLTPENVAEAVRTVRPYGVDVASGVESSPGRKDVEKMRRFIGNAREAAAR